MRLRLDSQYWPLVARGFLLALCALLSVNRLPPQQAIAPALLLLLVAALGTLPLPDAVPAWLQPLAETLAASLVVGALPIRADYFLPYLLIPLTTAGLNAGLLAGLVSASTAWLVFALTSTVATVPRYPNYVAIDRAPWIAMFFSVALVAGWMRRVIRSAAPTIEPAYADAHRLLSELHVVARQLSLGLDPQTLAAALVDELEGMAEGAVATVLIRSPGGRFVPLVGDVPSPIAESAVLDAWLAADLVRRSRSGMTVVALPVLMGERVVAVVVLTGEGPLEDEPIRHCRTAIAQAGPRLASALLFDDVRRLATVDERMRLAREIHDGIAQDMASVGYLLDDISKDAPPDVAERLSGLRQHLGGLVSELRLSIFDLRAGVDETVGLARTLGDYVTRVGQQAGLVVHVATDESPHRLPVATEVELLRIVQEAVTNIRKHAGASNLWLAVSVDPPRAHVTVRDDGHGLGKRRPESMGITGMKERARRIGAGLSVHNSLEGRGTVVEIVIDPEHPPARLGVSGGVATAELPTVGDSRQSRRVEPLSAQGVITSVGDQPTGRRARFGPRSGGDR
ncbi:MAG TPA: sensor histidine kinase [Kineosporiaceae bacterium]|nr:sensor histidine kinase [Kineosporiaceae bacterium]